MQERSREPSFSLLPPCCFQGKRQALSSTLKENKMHVFSCGVMGLRNEAMIRNKNSICTVVIKRHHWNLASVMLLIVCCFLPNTSAFCPIGSSLILTQSKPSEATSIPATLQSSEGSSNEQISSPEDLWSRLEKKPLWKLLQLSVASSVLALLVVSWEDLSMAHPMRQYTALEPLGSTVRGLAFGQRERLALQVEESFEPEQSQSIKSYNEVGLQHRTERVPTWEGPITEEDVRQSVATIQRAVVFIEECKALASRYEWEMLSSSLRDPILHSELETACGILKRADAFLSSDAREIVGFDWGRCVG
jgi:hypothetical protein